MNEKLKPCPFCGGEAELRNCVENVFIPRVSMAYVQCKKCKVHTQSFKDNGGNFEYANKAIESWNRRAENE